MDALDTLRQAVHRDPRGVEKAADEHVAAARAADDDRRLSRALAVRGRARRSLGAIDLAESDLLGALAAAARLDDAELTADAHVGLAGVLSFAGRTVEAFEHLDAGDRLGSAKVRAYCALQRAIIAQRVGRIAEALAAYDGALPVLRRLDARTDIALVLMNRGVVRIQTGECAAAVADLSEASRLFAVEGNDFGVAQTEHGLGWAQARRGDLPLALRHLDQASARFGALGHEALEVDQDRVEVLLAAGLCHDAAELGLATARRLDALGNHSLAAEVWLLCARAALLDGDRVAARAHSERARVTFAAQGSPGWERAARLESLRSGLDRADVAELIDLAAAQDAAGNARGAASALALAAVQAAEDGDAGTAHDLAEQAWQRARRLGILEVRVLAAQARASSALCRGERGRARQHVRAGLADVERHRAALAAGDARAAVALHGRQLAELGVRLAVQGGRADAVLRELERARAGRGRHLPARPDEDVQDGDLVALRAVAGRLREQEPAGGDVSDLLHEQRRLERAVHRRLLRLGAGGRPERTRFPSAAALRSALAGGCLVELAELDGRLVGVGVGAARPVLADLAAADEVRSVAATVAAALRAALFPAAGRGRVAAVDLLVRALRALDPAVAPLLSGSGPVVLVLPAALHALPWQLLPSLAGRPVVLAPSARWWLQAQQVPAGPPASGPVLLAAGPRLAEAGRELAVVAAHHPGATVLAGAAATTRAVLEGMAVAPLAHVVCHGRIRHDNPLWSCLELADGPLYVYDLERGGRAPEVVVLSGCETGVGVRAGDELLGLATALLDHGTRQLVASVCVLPDSVETCAAMAALHAGMARGSAPPTVLAALAADPTDPGVALVAGCLAGFGTH